jgi:hypothetical protein
MMMRVLPYLCVSLCLGLAPSAQAETLDINLSNKALRGSFSGSLSAVFPRVGGLYEMGALLGEEDSRKVRQGHLGVLVTGDAGAREANVTAGLGGRIVLLDAEQHSGGALALGGQIEARIPAFNRIGVIAYVYGAPRASSFGDLDGYLEYAASVDYQVLRAASIYAGYRQLKLDIENSGTATADNGLHLGLRLNF